MDEILAQLFPQAPSYFPGLLGQEQANLLQQQAQRQGLLGIGMGFLQAAAPSTTRPSLGAGIAQGLATGQQMAQNVYAQRLQEQQIAQKLAEQQRQLQQRETMRRLFPQVFQQTVERGAVAGEEGPIPTAQPRVSIDPQKLSMLAMASDNPLDALSNIGKTVQQLRQAGLTTGAIGETDPFTPFLASDNENIRNMAANYSRSFRTGALDEPAINRAVEVMSKMLETAGKPTGLSGEYANLALSRFGTADIRKLTPEQRTQLEGLVQQQKAAVAAAGRPSLDVKVGETAGATLAKGLGERVESSEAEALAAQQSRQTIANLKNVIGQGVMSGPLSAQTAVIARVGSTLGITGQTVQETLNRTTEALQGLASLELNAAQQMRGQGAITEGERALIARAAAGNLQQLTAGEVVSLLNALDKVSTRKIETHKRNVQRLKKVLPEELQGYADVFTTDFPEPTISTSAPGGARDAAVAAGLVTR